MEKQMPDILGVSEIKSKDPISVDGYKVFWNPAKTKKGGYAGSA